LRIMQMRTPRQTMVIMQMRTPRQTMVMNS
jgi:hypothetical protein